MWLSGGTTWTVLVIWVQETNSCTWDWSPELLKTGLKFRYFPRSEDGDATCLLGSVLPPLLWRRTLPCDRARPGFVGEKERSGGACSDEESVWWDCQRSPEFDHLEPLLEQINYDRQPVIIHDDNNIFTSNKWKVSNYLQSNRQKTEWSVSTLACGS